MSRPIVLVIGPPCAGVTSLVAALGELMADATVVEAVADGETVGAVVFAVSAVAPMTESDCAPLDGLLEPVIAAVTKIDAHRGWRDVLAANRAVLAGRGPLHCDIPWVGVAAAPDLGEPGVDDVVAALRRGFADVEGFKRQRVCRLEDRRRRIVGDHRRQRSTTALTVRGAVAQARVSLTYRARKRCAVMVAELRAEAATLSRAEAAEFEARVGEVAAAVTAEVDAQIGRELDVLAERLAVPLPTRTDPAPEPAVRTEPMPTTRRAENQLVVILGAGFGLGVALASGRLLASVADGLDVVGLVVGAVVGLAVTLWVIGIRGLLAIRAGFDRWVIEVGATARSDAEARVAMRLLAAEVALTTSAAERAEMSSARMANLIAEIDAEIRAMT